MLTMIGSSLPELLIATLVEILPAPNCAELNVARIDDPLVLIVSMFSRFYALKLVVTGTFRMAMRMAPDAYGASLTRLLRQGKSAYPARRKPLNLKPLAVAGPPAAGLLSGFVAPHRERDLDPQKQHENSADD